MSRAHIDTAAGGAFLSLTIDGTTALIEKMVSNQSWGEERSQKQQKGMHTMKEADMLATKMDLLMKRLDERAHEKEAMKGLIQAIDSHMTCEVCRNVGHSGTTALRPVRTLPTSPTGSDNKVITGGTTSRACKEVIRTSTPITIRINLP